MLVRILTVSFDSKKEMGATPPFRTTKQTEPF